MAFVFAACFASIGVFNPFFPVWLKSQGLDPFEISCVVAAQIGLRVFVCPLILRHADRSGDRALLLMALGIASAILVNLFFAASGFAAIMIVALFVAIVWSPMVPLSDAIALAGVRRLSIDYGRSRLWGSIAFICVNVVAGAALSTFGSQAILPMLSLAFAAAGVAILFTPRLGRPCRISPMPLDSSEPYLPTPPFRRLAPRPDIRAILPMLLAIALVQASHASFNAFGSIIWTGLGYSGFAVGCFWAIGVIAEIILFHMASRLVPRFGARVFLLAGGGAAILRWMLFGFDLGIAGFSLVQALHGLTFGATHLALQAIIVGSIAEERLGSAQGTAFAIQTGLIAAVTLLSGPAYAAMGARMYWLMAGIAFVGVVIAAASAYPQREAEGGETVASE